LEERLFTFEPMSEEHAREIVQWRYPEPYSVYDAGPEDFEALVDPQNHYHAALRAGELAGYFCAGACARVPGGDYAEEALDVGLGLRPDLVGRGEGFGFVRAVQAFVRAKYAPERFRLTVATFNRRAIRVYERAGFEWERVFETPAGMEFAQMAREA
jgi:ribosomal-protein-alanine N-acetyltransferase